jgi:ABC-type branched-subunit amino acid transport system ATPase component
MTTLLEVAHVSKAFGGVAANRDISMTVPERAIIGLIGPNGSGKTTLFNSIVGYYPIDQGSITFGGREISRLRVPEIARLGIVRTFQNSRVYGNMTCTQNMVISARATSDSVWSMLRPQASEAGERVERLLEFVGLAAQRDAIAGRLSFGQRKLLELAMALMADPKLLLLDEPTAGINPTLINGLLDRLRRANAQWGVTLLVIEHNMRVLTSLAQRVYCLAHGEVLAEDTPEGIVADSRVIDAYLGGR